MCTVEAVTTAVRSVGRMSPPTVATTRKYRAATQPRGRPCALRPPRFAEKSGLVPREIAFPLFLFLDQI